MEKIFKFTRNKLTLHILYLLVSSVFLAILVQYVLKLQWNSKIVITLTMVFLILSINYITRFLLLALSIVFSMLLPHAILVNGLLKRTVLDTILSSSMDEAFQYYKSIPLTQILYSILLSIIFISLFYLQRNIRIKLIKNKSTLIYLYVFILALFVGVSGFAYNRYSDRIYAIFKEYAALNTEGLPKTEWKIISSSPKYNTYIVIIGESMRKDFMSLYGFQEKTTPFIDSIPKKFISNYISTAVNTTLSVPRILTYSDKNGVIKEENNIITLAKLAGFKTYWISSQGYTGQYNISSGRISNFADYTHFDNQDDYSLLPEIKNAIQSKENKVIFVHIMGSHEHPCDRVKNYDKTYNTNKGELLNCYLSSYNKTDDFIKDIYNTLKDNGNSFSLAYFSDHALNMVNEYGQYKIYRDDSIRQSYEIPFFTTSSDDEKTVEVNVTRSAYNFFNYFPTWIGVETNITPKGYDIFNSNDDNPLVMSYDQKLNPLSSKKIGLSSSDIIK